MQMQNVVNYTVVDIQDSQPEGRLFHTFTQVQNGEAILLGGIKGPFQSYTFCDEIFVFNAILTQWTKLQLDSVLSEQITPRYGHAAAYLKINKILIFGGLTIDETIEPSKKEILTQNELYQLQYESKTSEYFWKTQVCVGEKPEKRTGASLSVVRRHVVLYGGNNLKNSFNDCWTLNLLNLNENNQVAWSRVDFTERVPPGRYAHTCVSISNDDIYDNIIIFGGKDETILNDFFTLKFINHKNQWLLTAHNVKNPMQHRVYHNTVSFGSCFINIGGRINNKDLSMTIEIFSVKSGKYLPLKVPYGINKFSSIIFNQQIYTFGGLSLNNPELPINDILQIDITEPLEFVLNFDITAPKERSSIHSDKKNSNEKPKDGKIIEEKITNISSNISTAPTQPGTPNSLAPPSSTAPSHANSPYSMNNLQLKIDSNQKIQKEEEQSFKIADFDTNFEKDRQMEEEIDLGALGGQLILQKSFSHQVEVGKSIEFLKDSPPVSPITEGISLQELEQMKFFEDPRATHNIILNEMLKPEEFRKKELDFTFSVRAISNLIAQADYLVQSEPTILQLSGPFKIFGDIHGQYNDLMRMFFYHGSPFSNGKNDDINKFSYLFLGDYVDRGKNSVEVMVLLLSLKIRYPKRVFLLRGNHEDRCINTVMGFHSECHFKFKENPEDPNSMFSKFNYFFNNLPLAAVLEKRFFCCHGGLGPYMMKNFAELKKIQRPIELPPPDRQNLSQSLLNEILWCDPAENESDLGFTSNDVRGGNGIQYFGKDVLAKFLDDNNFQMFIRAHQVVEKGFEEFHGGLGITVFSATNYCGLQGNSGAILIFSATESKFSIVPRMITPQVRHPDKQWDSEVNKKHPESPYSLKHSGYRKDLMPSAQLSQYTQ